MGKNTLIWRKWTWVLNGMVEGIDWLILCLNRESYKCLVQPFLILDPSGLKEGGCNEKRGDSTDEFGAQIYFDNLLNSYEIGYNCEDHANVEIKLNNGNNVCFS